MTEASSMALSNSLETSLPYKAQDQSEKTLLTLHTASSQNIWDLNNWEKLKLIMTQNTPIISHPSK
jgi:hypothetical protein